MSAARPQSTRCPSSAATPRHASSTIAALAPMASATICWPAGGGAPVQLTRSRRASWSHGAPLRERDRLVHVRRVLLARGHAEQLGGEPRVAEPWARAQLYLALGAPRGSRPLLHRRVRARNRRVPAERRAASRAGPCAARIPCCCDGAAVQTGSRCSPLHPSGRTAMRMGSQSSCCSPISKSTAVRTLAACRQTPCARAPKEAAHRVPCAAHPGCPEAKSAPARARCCALLRAPSNRHRCSQREGRPQTRGPRSSRAAAQADDRRLVAPGRQASHREFRS